MTETRKPGRPKATYAQEYLDMIRGADGEWAIFLVTGSTRRKTVRWLRNAGIEVKSMDLDGQSLFLVARTNHAQPDQHNHHNGHQSSNESALQSQLADDADY